MVILLAAALAAAPEAAVVIRPVANMYSKPSADVDVVSQAICSSHVGILEKQGAWFKIRTADDYTGWTAASNLRILQAGEKPYAASGRVGEVRNLFAHIYREPSVTKRAPLLTVPFETRLEITAEPEREDGRWLQTRLPDGRFAWVQRGDLDFAPRKLSIPEMLELSQRFLGLPYTWGGTSSFGYDCSGFTQMLCRRRGILMPRDAGPQCRWEGNRPVEKSELQPGDLLYFGPSPQKITHTGIYMGDGRFIHATTHLIPVIQISQLSDPHWTKLLVACRRPQ
jgi:hypothetical protein